MDRIGLGLRNLRISASLKNSCRVLFYGSKKWARTWGGGCPGFDTIISMTMFYIHLYSP